MDGISVGIPAGLLGIYFACLLAALLCSARSLGAVSLLSLFTSFFYILVLVGVGNCGQQGSCKIEKVGREGGTEGGI